MKKTVLILCATACSLLMACDLIFTSSPNEDESEARSLTGVEKALVQSNNEFGVNLFQEIVRTADQENIFISPLSVAMALGMTLNGAAATTYEDMKNTLGFAGMAEDEINQSFKDLIALLTGLDDEVQFDIANSIWIRDTFEVLQDFIDVNRDYFDALVRRLDFSTQQAVDTMNAWVRDNTQGKIDGIVDPPIDWQTVMLLINAIYFKGTWTYEFDEADTRDDLFNLPDGSQTTVSMMHRESEFEYLENDDFQAVNLPYGNEKFSMVVLLPKPDKDIDRFIDDFTPQSWEGLNNAFTEKTGILDMPKFRTEYKIKLNDILSAMGMEVAFRAGQADFSRINADQDLFISKVLHKTFVEVDEQGTEAAAVTSVMVSLESSGSGPSLDFVMHVDRPFLFAIVENHSDTILFIGKIVEPRTSE